MKISIVYSSQSGHTEQMGEVIREGILQVDDAIEVKLMNVNQENAVDADFLQQSDAVIFGTPTYVASTCWQLKKFFDVDCLKYNLGGKLAGCYATAAMQWGGPDLAIQNILAMALTKGMLAYSSGTGEGQPYIHLGPVSLNKNMEEDKAIVRLYGQRMARKCKELFG